jgi:hypothetical protein
MKKLLLLGLSFSFAILSFAQDVDFEEEYIELDPLKKPAIWERLEARPTDDNLWADYFEKDLFSLNDEEFKLYEKLKGRLQSKDLKAKEKAVQGKEQIQQEYARRFALQADPYLEELLQSPNKNYELIEEYFMEEFAKIPADYVRYDEQYPDKGYNYAKWVEEQQQLLAELKANR